jgi:hypothetical protein
MKDRFRRKGLMEKIRIIIYGCGGMGRKVAEALLDKKSFKIVGAVDIDPKLVGKDLAMKIGDTILVSLIN